MFSVLPFYLILSFTFFSLSLRHCRPLYFSQTQSRIIALFQCLHQYVGELLLLHARTRLSDFPSVHSIVILHYTLFCCIFCEKCRQCFILCLLYSFLLKDSISGICCSWFTWQGHFDSASCLSTISPFGQMVVGEKVVRLKVRWSVARRRKGIRREIRTHTHTHTLVDTPRTRLPTRQVSILGTSKCKSARPAVQPLWLEF